MSDGNLSNSKNTRISIKIYLTIYNIVYYVLQRYVQVYNNFGYEYIQFQK